MRKHGVWGLMGFLASLFVEPDAFRGQPYAYLTNQVGHIFLGGTIPMYVIFAIYKIVGIYPNQEWIAIFIFVAYVLLWEMSVQGFRGWDTAFDSLFFGIGAALYLFVEMDIVLDRMVTWLTLIGSILFVTTYRQYRISRNDRR